MNTSTREQVPYLIDAALEAREEAIRRGLSPVEALIFSGCALGIMLAGASGWTQ